ncbi:MAG: hypothetical protein KBC73_07270 [Burkholderiaceae bacterium]|nr:hypothetical protein [Burkholderiaceae bacterium]
MSSHQVRRSLLALALAGASALAWADGMGRPARAPEPQPDPEAALLARIQAEIGTARCDGDAQCRTLALGHKACGGPLRFVPWSAAVSRGDRLQAWADELAALQRKRQAQSGLVSNCMVQMDPGARCVQQRCQLGGEQVGPAPR